MKICTLCILVSCGPSKEERTKQAQEEKARIEALAQQKADSLVRVMEQEQIRQEQEQQKRIESAYPSGNSLKEREMRYYYAQGYDFGSHSTFSKADDEWMRKAFLYVVSQHEMSHAGNQTLFKSFMAGVAQGRAELNDLQNQ